MVVYDDFAGELSGVADDDVVAHDTVMRDVAAFHEEIAAANNGFAFGCRATVDGDVLTDFVVVPNDGECVFAAELEVLGDGTDDGTGEDGVS